MVLAAVASASLGFGTVAAGAATGSTSSTDAAVAQGIDPSSLPGATVFGNTPADTPETVSFILKERNENQLAGQVEQGMSQFLSVSQFANQYGQTPQNIAALESYLASYGIKTTTYADNVDISATGTAGEFDNALRVTQKQYHVPASPGHNGSPGVPAQTVHAPTGQPMLPGPLASFTLAILGLSDYSSAISQISHVDSRVVKPNGSSSDQCVALTGLPSACHLPSDFASNYGLKGLYRDGADGRGETIGIVTLASADQGAPEYFWQHVAGMSRYPSVNYINVDGGSGAPSNQSGTGETDLDIEQSGGVAPGATVDVYQAPNTDPGFADAFFTAASQNVADTISSSWGESETIVAAYVASGQETPAYEAAFDEAFLEMAAQGQSGFVSAGDQAAYDASADLGSTNLAVDTPGDSPFITSAGGTTLPWSGQLAGPGGTANVSVPNQRTWGWDYLWPAFATVTPESLTAAAESDVVGGGGGFSVVEAQPSYQAGVPGTSTFSAVQYLTPTDPQNINNLGLVEPTSWNFNPTPSVSGGRGSGRAEPDLSADADPFSGYLLYSPSFAGVNQPVLQGGWGGTSYVAPQLNGSTAVIDSALGHRIGLWNPTLYAAATSRRSPLTPLNEQGTGNDNIYYTGTPGTVYNPASGLGYPNLSALAADFPQ